MSTDYREKLKDPRWQRKRLQILERDGWRCQGCGRSDTTLHVHHSYYEAGREPWEYPAEALITLCADCHEKEGKMNNGDGDKTLIRMSETPRFGHAGSLVLRPLETADGVVKVGQRPEDGYINATALCKAAGKLFADWRRTDRTNEYLNELSSVMGIPIAELVQTVMGGNPYEQGSWVHPRVALRIAQWCSASFEVQVDGWLLEGLTGKPKEPVTGMDLLRLQVETLNTMMTEFDGIQKRQHALEVQVEDYGNRLQKIESEYAPPDYFTALGFCRLRRIPGPDAPQVLGMRATKLCSERGITKYEVPDKRWGTVGSYPMVILQEIAEDQGYL